MEINTVRSGASILYFKLITNSTYWNLSALMFVVCGLVCVSEVRGQRPQFPHPDWCVLRDSFMYYLRLVYAGLVIRMSDLSVYFSCAQLVFVTGNN